MKLAGIIIVLVILASAMISAHQHKPFEMLIDEPDAKPANWPTNAQLAMGSVMMCRPMVIELERRPKPIVRT